MKAISESENIIIDIAKSLQTDGFDNVKSPVYIFNLKCPIKSRKSTAIHVYAYIISLYRAVLNRSLYLVSLNMYERSMQFIDQTLTFIRSHLEADFFHGSRSRDQCFSFCNSHRLPKDA